MSCSSSNFDAIFWITVATIFSGSLALIVKYSLKSKCQSFSCCWGMVDIDRNVSLEVEEHIREIESGCEEKNDEN